jgi:hypothetical protein
MPRARWFAVGFVLVAAAVGGLLNARGPFDAHQPLAYDQFIADVQAGKVAKISQWRDQLEVAELGALRSVVVPADRDLSTDLGIARAAGGVGITIVGVPDRWVEAMTPSVPMLLALAAALIWATAILRGRRPVPMPGAATTPHAGG